MRFALKYVHCRRAAGKVEDVGESRAVSLNHPPPRPLAINTYLNSSEQFPNKEQS